MARRTSASVANDAIIGTRVAECWRGVDIQMNPVVIHARIRAKLAGGALPRDARVESWRGGARPTRCDACDERFLPTDVLESIAGDRRYYFHTECMYIWYLERIGGVDVVRDVGNTASDSPDAA